jgi:hypothetical protein
MVVEAPVAMKVSVKTSSGVSRAPVQEIAPLAVVVQLETVLACADATQKSVAKTHNNVSLFILCIVFSFC